MFWNYVLIAWRNIWKHRNYSLLNVGGLAIGIACFYLISLYTKDELSYDKAFKKSDRTFRIIDEIKSIGSQAAVTGRPWAPQLANDFPEIETYTRVSGILQNFSMLKDGVVQLENGAIFADSTFFEVFDYELLAGDPNDALNDPLDVVITETMALKHFNRLNAVDGVVRVNVAGEFRDFRVSGVVKDPDFKAHFWFNMIFTQVAVESYFPQVDPNNWMAHNLHAYVVLNDASNKTSIENRFPEFFDKYVGPKFNEAFTPSLQPIEEIHLKSNLYGELAPNSNINYLRSAIAIGLFILIIACVNFVNLATALSVKRAREVGARKVLGARKAQLIAQFMMESTLIALISMVVVVLLVEVSLPYFNELTDKTLSLNLATEIFHLLVIAFIVGVLAGIYPAIMLSSYQPLIVLKGNFHTSARGMLLRKGLIVFQFTISVILFIGTGIIYDQIKLIQNKDLGFDQNGVIAMDGVNPDLVAEKIDVLRNELGSYSNITSVSMSSSYPGTPFMANYYRPEGFVGEDGDRPLVSSLVTDHHIIDALGLELIAGRDFDENRGTDETEAFIINERAAEVFDFEDPIGKELELQMMQGPSRGIKRGKVIGLIKDFHFESLHSTIAPLVLHLDHRQIFNVIVNFQNSRINDVVEILENEWAKQFPQEAFNYTIIQDNFQNLHHSDYRLQRVFAVCALLAVIIAALGLFGLATFTAQQKTREIGIRKVLGASLGRLIFMLNRDFTIPVLVSILISSPIAYYLMVQWLDDFAYRVDFNFWLIPIAGLIALVIAWITISVKSFRAAQTNPVNALRYE